MHKMQISEYSAIVRSQQMEQMIYRNFKVILNSMSDGTFEIQAYRMVNYGNRQISSIYSSIYKSSVEYAYKYDPSRQKIIQYHFLFPPNSLTGWANPGQYAGMDKFDWGEKFPARSCSQSSPIHTLEETGREYLEAACIPDRETALRFARSFIDYMLGNRGM
jgi:hypothetical protein